MLLREVSWRLNQLEIERGRGNGLVALVELVHLGDFRKNELTAVCEQISAGGREGVGYLVRESVTSCRYRAAYHS